MICDFYPTLIVPTSLNNFLSETHIKDVLKASSEIYYGRLVSYKQINFIKTENTII